MAEEHHHHLFGRHHKEEEEEEKISDDVEFAGGHSQTIEETVEDYEVEKNAHKHKEHLGEIDAQDDDDDFDLYEKEEAKKETEHRSKHKIEEAIPTTAIPTTAGVERTGCAACHECHGKIEARENEKKEEEEAEDKTTHHLFQTN